MLLGACNSHTTMTSILSSDQRSGPAALNKHQQAVCVGNKWADEGGDGGSSGGSGGLQAAGTNSHRQTTLPLFSVSSLQHETLSSEIKSSFQFSSQIVGYNHLLLKVAKDFLTFSHGGGLLNTHKILMGIGFYKQMPLDFGVHIPFYNE